MKPNLDEIVDKHFYRLCKKKNVIGVGVGIKVVDSKPTDEPAVLVFVSNKESLKLLSLKDRVELSIDGVKTDVVGRVGKIQALRNLDANLLNLKSSAITLYERPIRAGISIGHLYVTAGTLGGFFLDKQNDVVLLSNEHVIAGEKFKGQYGLAPQKGNIIIQPGRFDGGTIKHGFAHLKEWVTLKSKNNLEDSAIAKIDNLRDIVNEIKGLGKINGFASVKIGQKVKKVGRSTGLTTGKVISMKASVCVEYDTIKRCFKDCIVTTNMSQGGDSGSILLDENMNAVGLLFAGSDRVTIYNPISYPMKTYGLKLWNG